MELRAAGLSAADVPCVGCAADRAMDDVQGVGNGIKHDSGAAEHAGTLAHRTRRTGFVTSDFRRGVLAVAQDLTAAIIEDVDGLM